MRLKVSKGCTIQDERIFQFLSGAIKRACVFLAKFMQTIFQFLSGAIKSAYCVRILIIGITFQFLSGAIKSTSEDLCFKALNIISIPKWCD